MKKSLGSVIFSREGWVTANVYIYIFFFGLVGDSMSNHPIFLDVDTLTSQILFIFSLLVDNVEMINP